MPRWYVVQTKARQESTAQENLQRQGYPSYCPRIAQSRRRRGNWRKVIEPLFPRYLFVQLTEGKDDFTPIRSTFGVSTMLRFGGKPASLSQQAIEAIRQQEQQLEENDPNKLPWKKGDRLQVLEGPFAGLSGIFQKQSDQERVIILLELLGKENHLKVAANNLATFE
ncbi:transcription/translation regulatory transformer protein RfaH [Thiohalomonas denitrificans]|uniref:Transcriptional antiterminator RfaH n=1 Tax=Thiohalomonas denitrificans TaxID=415747 RepID=A0A1G5R0H4_9GAMM|nr:transcription/translation regulatory transformer protein RfaH [Thiohalomonas denitrificans]SCZ67348.1 transcriptional antiterminator RfaH [Thiohalomonas denitrificans]